MSGGFRPTVAEIDRTALKENAVLLRQSIGASAFFCPMIKANAYGHGAIEVARALRSSSVSFLGVALIEEGVELRESGDQGRILVFGLFSDRASVEELLRSGLTPVISDWSQLEALDSFVSEPTRVRIHLKFNTGMNRLGFPVTDAEKLRDWLTEHPTLELEGVCTHLLSGDDAAIDTGHSRAQLHALDTALKPFAKKRFYVHALNSGAMAALSGGGAGGGSNIGGRPGIALYGAQPSQNPAIRLAVRPVMSLRSRLAVVSKVKRGARVSYSATWTAERDSLIGVVPAGYADGVPRLLSNKGSILCRGRRAPIAGTVCMDYFMIDLTDIPRERGDIGIDEQVTLIGEQDGERITAEEIAAASGTISYEVFTGIGGRVPRRYL